jgi:hypothetical protein
MAQTYIDLTSRLDELYEQGAFAEFTPDVTDCAKMVRRGSAKNINERGAFYLSQSSMPMNFASSAFGASAGSDFGDGGKTTWLKQNVGALKRTSSVKWQDENEVQSKPGLLQKPVKSVNDKMALVIGLLKGYAVQWSRELWSDRTNEVARVSAINTGTKVVTCANSGNLFGVGNIYVGMDLMFYSSGGTLRSGNQGYVTVTGVNRANRTFTYAVTDQYPTAQVAPNSIANGDIIYTSQGTTSNKDAGLSGVKHLLGQSGAFQGTSDRTINNWLMGTYYSAGGSAVLSASLLRYLKSNQYYNTFGKENSGKYYASTQKDAYEATELGKQSYAQDGETMKKGYRKLYFDDAPFEKDMYVPRDAVFFVDLSKIDRFELSPFAPIRDAAGYELRVPSTSGGTYQGNKMILFQGWEQLGTESPAELGAYMDGLSTSGLSVGYTS